MVFCSPNEWLMPPFAIMWFLFLHYVDFKLMEKDWASKYCDRVDDYEDQLVVLNAHQLQLEESMKNVPDSAISLHRLTGAPGSERGISLITDDNAGKSSGIQVAT